MDEERLIGIQKIFKDKKDLKSFERERSSEVYKKALEDITRADTAGQMLDIAYRVLSENRK